MKKRIVFLSLVLWLMLTCGAGASAQKSKSGNGKIVEPTAKEAVKLVFANGDILLSAAKDCQSMATTADDKTIFDFLTGVLAFQTEADSQNKLTFEFKPAKGKNGENLWQIDLMFSGQSAADPWSNGVRFLMRDADRKMIRRSLQCTGTG